MEQSKEMKIDQLSGINVAEKARAISLINAGRTADPEAAKQAQSSSTVAQVGISSKAETVQRFTEKAAAFPYARQERVEALRCLIESDSYRPSSEEIADSIIRSELQHSFKVLGDAMSESLIKLAAIY